MTEATPQANGSPPCLNRRLWLRLFVAGTEVNSQLARENLLRLCEQHAAGCYELEVIDVLMDFKAALADGVFVTPALIVVAPPPRIVVFGSLSDTRRVLSALHLPGGAQ